MASASRIAGNSGDMWRSTKTEYIIDSMRTKNGR